MTDRPSTTPEIAWRNEPLLFERSRPGRVGVMLPPSGVEERPLDELIPAELRRGDLEELPELSEVDVIRHFTRISRKNYAIDLGLYPLGSCTMKHNPRINEEVVRYPGLSQIHPYQPEETVQGCLELMWHLERVLVELTGMQRVSLHPSAGAQGELAGVLMIRKALEARGENRRYLLIPDSAHGTNPASAYMAGFQVKELVSNDRGTIDLEEVVREMSDEVAGAMITVPNTLGVFEDQIVEIADMLHEKGAFLYCDGANFNAYVGKARPGQMGVDVLHMNLHKTFTTPHGGGGPGAGPVAASHRLADHLPGSLVERAEDGTFRLRTPSDSIGRLRSFSSQFGILTRALCYILSMGGRGLAQVAENAVLNANYLRKALEGTYHLAHETPSLHEVVFSDRTLADTGVTTLDVAKRLMDYGFHPPTIYFPLIVHGALMIEPTETEGKEELDAFVAAMKAIAREARESPELVREAPHETPVRRCDEARAARQPVLRWWPAEEEAAE